MAAKVMRNLNELREREKEITVELPITTNAMKSVIHFHSQSIQRPI